MCRWQQGTGRAGGSGGCGQLLPQPDPKSSPESLPLPTPHHGLTDLLSLARSRTGVRPVGAAEILGSPPSTAGFAPAPARAAGTSSGGPCATVWAQEQGRMWGPIPPGSSQPREQHLRPLSPVGDTADEANPAPKAQHGLGLVTGHECGCKPTAAAKSSFFSRSLWQNREGGRNLSLCHRT